MKAERYFDVRLGFNNDVLGNVVAGGEESFEPNARSAEHGQAMHRRYRHLRWPTSSSCAVLLKPAELGLALPG